MTVTIRFLCTANPIDSLLSVYCSILAFYAIHQFFNNDDGDDDNVRPVDHNNDSNINNLMLTQEAEAEQKLEILNWISAVIEEPINTKEPFEKVLKDGVILCKYDYNHLHKKN